MFTKYSSLTNHTDKKFLQKLIYAGLTSPKVVWVAREKIHGTNFSLIVNKSGVTAAKRTGVIDETEGFFEYEDIVKRYKAEAEKIFATLVKLNKASENSDVQIYGEYAGNMKTGKKIQQSIEYGDQNLYLFDIRIDGQYLDDTDFMLALIGSKFMAAPLVAIGSFDELINIRNDFDSIVQEWATNFNATVWEKKEHLKYTGENTAEGFVMRPITNEYVGNERVVIKHKNEKFSERKNKVKNFVAPVEMTEKDKEVLAELLTYNTENRVRNVLSKIGTPKSNEFGKVMGLTVQDILEESAGVIETADNIKVVKKTLIVEVGNLIRPNWINIFEGEF